VKNLGVEQPRVPLAFTFVASSEASLPANLLPMGASPRLGPVVVCETEGGSPCRVERRGNFQDVLVFDAGDGTLELRRVVVDVRVGERGAGVGGGGGSSSLPGMGGAGRLSVSPSAGGGLGGQGGQGEMGMELVGRESVVATWNLQRRADWGVVRRVLEVPGVGVRKGLVKAE